MTPDPVAIVRGALNKPMLSKEDCLAVWVAVLEGVREPNDVSLRAGMTHRFQLGHARISIDDTWSTWTAMIDALLAEIRG